MSDATPAVAAATSARRFWAWVGLTCAVIALDQASKAVVLARFALHESIVVTDFFNLVLVFNSGAAFSFLAQAGGWQKWFFVVLSVGISAWLTHWLRGCAHQRLLPTALSFVIGGALGNVLDRLRFDAVVDFLDFHLVGWHWPAFNLADSFICVGVALMLWHQLRYPEHAHD